MLLHHPDLIAGGCSGDIASLYERKNETRKERMLVSDVDDDDDDDDDDDYGLQHADERGIGLLREGGRVEHRGRRQLLRRQGGGMVLSVCVCVWVCVGVGVGCVVSVFVCACVRECNYLSDATEAGSGTFLAGERLLQQ
jgi:hypothetical protein